MRFLFLVILILAATYEGLASKEQMFDTPERGEPGDEMIQEYLRRTTETIHEGFMTDVDCLEDWKRLRAKYKAEYFYMLGLSPMPERTPLEARITGTLEREDYSVEMVHYQSRPRLYVTGNLYRPRDASEGRRLPAVLYVCGHSTRGRRNGNKTAYQSNGIWFARHGYICLILDTLQLGEIRGVHRGTYNRERWWWLSRGYTPAGVECLNGIRGIDYLISRSDVDPNRIAVTGISGGGAATFWIAAADERVKAAVPISGMSELVSYVSNRVINGHCDCMFFYNVFEWPWTRIAALTAPRALLFINSNEDSIFPMEGNRRIINRLEEVYSLYGAGDFVDSVVSMGGHSYRQDIRRSTYRFINMHLKEDPRIVRDSEVDLVRYSRRNRRFPIEPDRLRVFPKDSDIPAGEMNTTIDHYFVPMAHPRIPDKGSYRSWKATILSELKRVTFRYFPERIPPADLLEQNGGGDLWLVSEPGIKVRLKHAGDFEPSGNPNRILLVVENVDSNESDWINNVHKPGDVIYFCATRGIGPTRWTHKNPPNYVERCHFLLGRTVDSGRVWDIIATARYLRDKYSGKAGIYVVGEGGGGVLAAYAALLEEEITGVMIKRPPLSHMSDASPQFLNVLRICDIADVLGMLAPRALTIYNSGEESLKKTAEIYAAAEVPEKFVQKAMTRSRNKNAQ